MASLFYTLFKYKEKAQKDELGYYPEKVNVRAFPERKYLWTSRFFVVMSCLSLCLSMILASSLIILVPLKKVRLMPLQIDYERYQVIYMGRIKTKAFAGDLATESVLEQYIISRYTIGDSYDELEYRLGKEEFVELASKEEVYRDFVSTEKIYFEMLQKKGIRREVKVTSIYPVSFDFWQVRFNIIETDTKKEETVTTHWIATIRMQFSFDKYKYKKDLGVKNPFGLTVVNYDISYMGSDKKSENRY